MNKITNELVRVAKLLVSDEKVDDSEFWQIVEEVDWARDFDYKRISKELKKLYSASQRKEIEKLAEKKADALDKAISGWCDSKGKGVPCGDDSYSDLRYHIIGLGKAKYDAVMRNPQKGYKMADNSEYVESFLYALNQ